MPAREGAGGVEFVGGEGFAAGDDAEYVFAKPLRLLSNDFPVLEILNAIHAQTH